MTTSQVRLRDLGWDDSWREALGLPDALEGAAVRSPVLPGRISRVDRGLCVVLTETGPVRASVGADVLEAMARDSLAGPCTGDWCRVREWPDGPVTIDRLAPRRTLLQRAEAARGSRGQALAANVDVAAVVVALHPEPNLGRIERLLTIAWESGARPMVLLTKCDLVVDAAAIAEDTRAVAPSVAVVVCSATTGEGIDRVRGFVGRGATLALLGASGHGKSSLANRLVGAPLLTTRTIRDDGKGRHTSVRRELVLLPDGGAIIDTPGLRGVGLQEDSGSLAAAFPDVEHLAEGCRFRDCGHLDEPGCAVLAAVTAGEMAVRRLESWQRLHRDLERTRRRVAARQRAAHRRRRPS